MIFKVKMNLGRKLIFYPKQFLTQKDLFTWSKNIIGPNSFLDKIKILGFKIFGFHIFSEAENLIQEIVGSKHFGSKKNSSSEN